MRSDNRVAEVSELAKLSPLKNLQTLMLSGSSANPSLSNMGAVVRQKLGPLYMLLPT